MALGYKRSDEFGVTLVMKLNKNRYGLRQSPRKNWSSTMDHHLGKIGFRFFKPDPYVHVYEDENGSTILTLYVDDALLDAKMQLLDKLKKKLMDRFEMTDMGDVSRVLGINFTRDHEEGTITINQKYYTEDIVQRYGIGAATPHTTEEWDLNCP